MGTGFSSFSLIETAGVSPPSKPRLGDLPENCVSIIYSFLDPTEISKFAVLSRNFHGASLADFVWESKLPSNYKYLIDKVVLANQQRSHHFSKKEMYAMLCRPNRFDGGTKEVWLDKRSGKVFLSISSKVLKVTGIEDRRYWNFISTDESRVLLGKSSRRFGRRVCNLDQVHGWEIKPVRFHLSTSNGQQAMSQCYLHEAATAGNWIHYHVGDFVVDKNMPLKLKFSMVQIDCTHTKGGLCLDSVLIYPSDFKEIC